MTSRERVIAAINHRPVDRAPVDFGGTRQSGISAFSYAKLRKRLGLDERRRFRVFDVFQMLAEVEQEVSERFGADCVALNRTAVAFGLSNARYRPYELGGIAVLVPEEFDPQPDADGNQLLYRNGEAIACMPKGGFYFDRLERYPGAAHVDLDKWEAPRLKGAELEHYHAQAEALFTQTDKAVVAAMGPPYELFYGLGTGGFEDWMVTFASEDEYVQRLYDKLVEAWLDNLKAFHEAVGERVQVIQIADDLGTQHGPFLSVEMFRGKVMPAYARGLEWVHRHTSWKVLLHSDGAIYSLIPSLIEMGVDILNPVQPSVPGMELRRLKEEFGGRLAFWGGACDPQHTLAHAAAEQVAEEVRRNVSILCEGSGYVMAPVHNIQADVPPDNVIAMFDAARQVSTGSMSR